MPTFIVECTWLEHGQYEIDADTEEEATEIAYERELPEGSYISGSFEVTKVTEDGYQTVVCPSCENECKDDDVTFADHGVCYDCHKEILNGERCSLCYEVGHTVYSCQETGGGCQDSRFPY